ncbi:TCR/Tet family MFS transporter [Pelagovum sp. HNIBRBA483]|uniref:TCR/Tet family MFS transporter n=1 Tax=Pelagovum sp. HNIBRBA483 TaxID=3233341 RepID=UPI0034A59986
MRLPVLFILITIVIDSMGIGLIMPVMPDLIRELHGGSLGNAAIWGGILTTAFAVMQFLFGPTVGNLSDWYGRRPILLVTLVVMAADYMVMAVAGTIWLLFIGRIVAGITAATHSAASAYMADISKPDEKAANFGLIGAAFGVGFVLGPMIGGLLGTFGTRAPFYAAAALAILNAGFGYFVLPETVTDRIRRPFEWRRANPLGAFRYVGSLPGFAPLLVMLFLAGIAFFVYPAVWAFYGQERFGWGPGLIGLSLGAYGIGTIFAQGLLIRPVLKRFGEYRTVLIGLTIDIIAFVSFAFVTNGYVALALAIFASMGSIMGPALQAILSRAADDNQQGELQGTMAAINALASIVAPLMMTGIFAYFTAAGARIYLPGAPFLLSAALVIGGLFLFTASSTARKVS